MASYNAVYDDGLSLGGPVFTVTTARQPRVQLCTGASGGDVDCAQSAFFGRWPPQHIAGGRNWCSSHGRWNAPLGGQPGPCLPGLPERASGTGLAEAPGMDLTGAAAHRRGAPGIVAARLPVAARPGGAHAGTT